MESRNSRYGNQNRKDGVRDVNCRWFPNRKDGVRNVNWRWFPFCMGVVLTVVLPLLLDWALFGTPFPCKTIQVFEDGSSVQSCEVRK